MKIIASFILGLSILIFLPACSTTGPSLPENAVVDELPTMTLPAYRVGQRVDFTNELTGDSEYWEVTNIAADGTVFAIMSNGCKWNTSASWFDGVGGWEDCGGTGKWSAGNSTAIGAGPSLWPLKDGATANYKFKTTNKAGESDTHRRSCNVSTANIDTDIGPLDAYKIVCKDNNQGSINVRTWYFNPEHGELLFTRWKPDGGMRVHQKYF